jgi:hypothetical protein
MPAAGQEMTLRVRALVNVPPAGKVPLDGLKVHDNPVGRLGQLNANWSVKLFKEFMETLIAMWSCRRIALVKEHLDQASLHREN